jgi:hypothetical protein
VTDEYMSTNTRKKCGKRKDKTRPEHMRNHAKIDRLGSVTVSESRTAIYGLPAVALLGSKVTANSGDSRAPWSR